jgi:hypothetical protein
MMLQYPLKSLFRLANFKKSELMKITSSRDAYEIFFLNVFLMLILLIQICEERSLCFCVNNSNNKVVGFLEQAEE